MALFDIESVKSAAKKEINDEAVAKAKTALVAQMRVVAAAESVLAKEKLKLTDIEARIVEGSL